MLITFLLTISFLVIVLGRFLGTMVSKYYSHRKLLNIMERESVRRVPIYDYDMMVAFTEDFPEGKDDFTNSVLYDSKIKNCDVIIIDPVNLEIEVVIDSKSNSLHRLSELSIR